jgi:hypothetical protein
VREVAGEDGHACGRREGHRRAAQAGELMAKIIGDLQPARRDPRRSPGMAARARRDLSRARPTPDGARRRLCSRARRNSPMRETTIRLLAA